MSDAQLIQIPLGGGLDETFDDAFVPADKMRACSNVVFTDTNTCRKRQGLTTVATTGGVTKLVAHGNEVLIFGGSAATAIVPSQPVGSNVAFRGLASPCTVSRALLASGNSALTGGTPENAPIVPLGSVAEDPVTKLRVYAWSDGISIQASVWDTVAGTYVLPATQLNAQAADNSGLDLCRPRVVLVGTTAFVIYVDASTGHHLVNRAIDLTHPLNGFAAQVTFGTIAAVTVPNAFDACSCFATDGSALVSIIVTQGGAAGCYFLHVVAGALTFLSGVVLEIVNPTNFTGVSVAPSPNVGTPQVCCSYASYFLSGSTNDFTMKVATVSCTSAGVVTVLNLSALQVDNDTPTNALAAATFQRGIGITYIGQQSGDAAWWITWTRDYRIAARVGAIAAADHRDATSFYCAPFGASLAPQFFICGPLVGYQTQSKPFAFNALFYVLAQFQDGQRSGVGSPTYVAANPLVIVTEGQQTLVLLQLPGVGFGGGAITSPSVHWRSPSPVAVAAPRFAGDAMAGNADVAHRWDGAGVTLIGTEKNAAVSTSLTALTIDFADVQNWQSVRLGDWTWIAGGLPMLYDGSALTEVGFVGAPLQPTLADAGGGATPKIAALTYQIVYVQQDAAGNTHRSPPSNAAIVNSTAFGGGTRLAIVPCRVTHRQTAGAVANVIGENPVRIEVYRNNSGAGFTVMQLIASIPNDQTVAEIVFDDFVADAAGVMPGAPFIYVTGGGVPSDGPPCLTSLAVHSDRLFGVSEDGRTVYFTTASTRGEAPRFTDAFTLSVPDGPVTAAWSLEARLHFATARNIFYSTGDGPSDNGAGNNLTSPVIWRSDLGVVDSRAVCLCEPGAILGTLKGVYLEDRAGNLVWLGQRFQRTIAASPVITSMTALDSDGAVRITLQAAEGPAQSGVTVHWDYRKDRLSTHVVNGNAGLVSTCLSGGQWFTLLVASIFGTLFGAVSKEDPSTNLDAGNLWVTAQLTTGWVDLAGKQGSTRLHRTMLLGQSVTPHGMTIETARDYAPGFDADAGVWTDAQVSAMSIEQMRYTPTQQKGMAFSIRLTDQAPTTNPVGAGAGPVFRSLLLRSRTRRGEWKRTTNAQQG